MKIEWLHSKFPSQTEMIGHLYDRNVDDDEDAAKNLDTYLANRSDWKIFKSQIQKGDELWLFRSGVETWRNNTGKEGYSIVRNGKIVNSFQTAGPL